MDPDIVARLLDLNREFYTEFAESFAATRSAPWPGFARMLPYVREGARILDIGCGNGRVARYLDENLRAGTYTGLDFSEPMLSEARRSSAHLAHLVADFRRADVSRPEWSLILDGGRYDAVLALAVLQHVPSFALRVSVVSQVARLLAPNGVFVMSHWQFVDSDRLRRRIVPWSQAGIAESDVEPGDYLLQWRRDGVGHRYCHLITELEVAAMASSAALELVQTFRADGREGNLNLYALLAQPGAARTYQIPD